jgi:hypothetical protein
MSIKHSVKRAKLAPRRTKYGNVAVVVDGIKYASQAEERRHSELKLLQRIGWIEDLRLQVPFEIAPACELYGKKSIARVYRADFTYKIVKTGELVVEDVKGVRTDLYILKRHLMKVVHNIEIKEV